MSLWTTRRGAWRTFSAIALAAGSLSGQAAKCELPLQSHPKMLTAGFQFNNVFKPTATPADKAKALAATMKALTDEPAAFPPNIQPSRNFLLSQVLLVWLEQPGIGIVEPRGKLGYTANPTGTADIAAVIDTAYRVIRAAKPECSDSLNLYTKGVWGTLINKAVAYSNNQQLDSAEIFARRSLQFDDKSYYAYNILANIALTKDDTTGMIEWFTKTADITAASTDTNALKVRDNMLQNLGALYSNAAIDATGPKRDSLNAKSVATWRRYLGYYPNDLSTKLRIMRLTGATMDSASASRFADEVMGNVAAVTEAQLVEAGNELTTEKLKLWSSGLRFYEAALQKNPNSRDGLYNAAVALNNLERFDEIRPYFVRLKEIDPNNPGIFSLARNVQTARKLAVQTRANKGVKPRAGQSIMLTPVQAAQIKVFNDSLVYYTGVMQNMTPVVNVRSFSPAADGAKFGAAVQLPDGKPASAFTVTVDFLNATGAVVTSQAVQTKQIAPGGSETINAEGKGAGIVAFRYRVAK